MIFELLYLYICIQLQLHISANYLRCIGAMYVSPEVDEGRVNYEKVLSFISACLKEQSPAVSGSG